MASDHVEIVRGLYDCFRRRDNETPFEFYAEDIVWDARGAHIPGLEQIYRGHDGVRTFWRQWLEAWEEIEFETEKPVELDDGRVEVLVRQRNRGRGPGSGWTGRPTSTSGRWPTARSPSSSSPTSRRRTCPRAELTMTFRELANALRSDPEVQRRFSEAIEKARRGQAVRRWLELHGLESLTDLRFAEARNPDQGPAVFGFKDHRDRGGVRGKQKVNANGEDHDREHPDPPRPVLTSERQAQLALRRKDVAVPSERWGDEVNASLRTVSGGLRV